MRVRRYIFAAVLTAFAFASPVASSALAAPPTEDECHRPSCHLFRSIYDVFEYRLKFDAEKWAISERVDGYFIRCATCSNDVQTEGRVLLSQVGSGGPVLQDIEVFRRRAVSEVEYRLWQRKHFFGVTVEPVGGFESFDHGPMKGFSHRFNAQVRQGENVDVAVAIARDNDTLFHLLIHSGSANQIARANEIGDLLKAVNVVRIRHKRTPPPDFMKLPSTQDLLRGYSEEEKK